MDVDSLGELKKAFRKSQKTIPADKDKSLVVEEMQEGKNFRILIIDGKIVIAGSYNFSRSAEERNDENVLIIHNAQAAEIYLDEFERVLAKAISE